MQYAGAAIQSDGVRRHQRMPPSERSGAERSATIGCHCMHLCLVTPSVVCIRLPDCSGLQYDGNILCLRFIGSRICGGDHSKKFV